MMAPRLSRSTGYTSTVTSAQPAVGLSTSSVFPEGTAYAFDVARRLGYDGIEVMVGTDEVSADLDAVARLGVRFRMPILSVHSPCLMVMPRVWGSSPAYKLDRAVEAAQRWGATTVVTHPPFRWQRDYRYGFVRRIKELNRRSGITVTIENMYPWRTPGGDLRVYAPHWDPTDSDFDHLTLDLSHAATAGVSALEYVSLWGERLAHVHLNDGSGTPVDEHLMPGAGNQGAAGVMRAVSANGFTGSIVVEINTRVQHRTDREQMLAQALQFARANIVLRR